MLNDILTLVAITFFPFFEINGSIPYGIFKTELGWINVFMICVVANIALAVAVYFFVEYMMGYFLRVRFIDNIYEKIIRRTQRNVKPYVEKYGAIGLAVFIGMPFPTSGVYAAGIGAYLLGFKFIDYLIASIIGVLLAGLVILLITIFGNGVWVHLLKGV